MATSRFSVERAMIAAHRHASSRVLAALRSRHNAPRNRLRVVGFVTGGTNGNFRSVRHLQPQSTSLPGVDRWLPYGKRDWLTDEGRPNEDFGVRDLDYYIGTLNF